MAVTLEELEFWQSDPTRPGPFVEDVIGLTVTSAMSPSIRCRVQMVRVFAALATLADIRRALWL